MSKEILFTDKAKRMFSGLFPDKEKHIESAAFSQNWDEDTCLALKTEIGANPQWVDVDQSITKTYNRLVSLLGLPDREGVNLTNLKNRIIFTDPETIMCFMYMFMQPGENSDVYWKSPVTRVIDTRGLTKAGEIIATYAVTYNKLGIILIPNTKSFLHYSEKDEQAYVKEQSVKDEDYPELYFKRILAHELTHLLYPKSMAPHGPLLEPIADYIALLAFPEIQGIMVQLAWAKASVENYIKRLGYESVRELTQPILKDKKSKEKLFREANDVCQKFFPKINYQTLSISEEILNKNNVSKYAPIPETE